MRGTGFVCFQLGIQRAARYRMVVVMFTPLTFPFVRLGVALWCALLFPAGLSAQFEAQPRPTSVPAAGPAAATNVPLVISNRPIVKLRATVLGATPELRARQTQEAASGLLKRRIYGPVNQVAHREGILIRVGAAVIIRIAPDDVDPFADRSLEATADAAAQNNGAAFVRSVGRLAG